MDAMGGDYAPRAPIAGALHALANLAAVVRGLFISRSRERKVFAAPTVRER